MCHKLISSNQLNAINAEYKIILKEKNAKHQFICSVWRGDYLLACIDPNYRHGKPLKYLMDSRHMILAMCDRTSLSNVGFAGFPVLHDIKYQGQKQGVRFKSLKVELLPIERVQRRNVHYTIRPFIEFNHVDTYGPLRSQMSDLLLSSIGCMDALKQKEELEEQQYMNNIPTQNTFQRSDRRLKAFCFDEFLNSLPE